MPSNRALLASLLLTAIPSPVTFAADPVSSNAPDNAPPVIELLMPPAGSPIRELKFIEIHFDEPVLGLDAADLMINGLAATNVTEFGPGQFVFSFSQPADGTVSITWRADHGITDRAATRHPFVTSNWSYKLDSTSPAPDVYISEFLADNKRGINDEDGDNSDWIEIFNAGATTASLHGWFLTDETNNPAKWRIPNVALGPNEYLIVYASEKNKTNIAGRLHTNFKLSIGGEYLALVSPSTNVMSQFFPAYPPQVTDITCGRVPGAPQNVGYFVHPTPGKPNVSSGAGFAPAVNFSAASQTFLRPFDLKLSLPSPNAVIRYTLDGNLPTNGSPAYVSPIPITNSMQVRARAFQDGLLPGPPRTETFIMLSNNLVSFTSDLPVVIIHSLGKGAPVATRQNFAHISVYEPINGVTSLTNPPTLVTRSGIKVRGSSTEGLPKSSWALEFWDEFNQDKKEEFVGLPAESDWVAYAPNVYDPVLIHNPFIHQLSRDIGDYSPRTRFVEVYLNRGTGPVGTTNYNGIYVIEDKIKIGKNRVDIDKLEPEHLRSPEVTGGYILKIDRLDPGDGGFSAGGQSMGYVDPKEPQMKSPQRDPQEQYIKSYLNDFSRALSSTNWLHPTLGYAQYIDLAQWVDFHIVEVLSGNVDAIVLSTYLHKPRSGKLLWGPHWDFDRALGSTDGRDANPRGWSQGPFFSSWFTRVFRDRDAWQKWADRYQELRFSHLSTTNMHRLIDELADEVRQAQPRERQKWRTVMRGGSYQGEVNLMKNWLSNRVDFLDRQFVRPPTLSAASGRIARGFTLDITRPTNATAVYFTLDGSDPRLPQGEISPKAIAFSRPIALNENSRVVTRGYNPNQRQVGGPPISTPWSAPTVATFVVTPPPLLLTEIMFHPESAPTGNTNAASAFEFLELKNVGPTALSLPGFRLVNGIRFAFAADSSITTLAPGERLVLVKNKAAFLSRYPGVTNIAGEFTGSLADQGNRLTMVGPMLEPVFDVPYDDKWQVLADGFGFSLVLASETLAPDKLTDASSWHLSAVLGGSPGKGDAPKSAVFPIYVNELVANPDTAQNDAVELFNPNAQAVDVTGWYLTDDFRNPKKFRLPNRSIPANGYLVLDNLEANRASALSFSRLGEQVYLFSADAAGHLTGWYHGFDFGASDAGVSFGRHAISTGAEAFAVQTRPTLGQINAGPRVGPIVISEIMYEPTPIGRFNNADDEFIELRNVSSQSVSLVDPLHATNSWRLRGGVDYDFPRSFSIPAGAFVVLVSFDPQANPLALAGFRSRYGLGATTSIVGPWRGNLNNAGDDVRLLKPGEPDVDTESDVITIPFSLVDGITYLAQSPWPTNAGGTGLSLSRRDLAAFADDPSNWAAGLPSPGDSDSDSDGLPDRWEIAVGLDPKSSNGEHGGAADVDGDGFTNLQEFLSGTPPKNPAGYLHFEAAGSSAGTTKLVFSTIPNRKYTLHYRTSLAAGPWQALNVILAPPNGGPVELTDVSTNVTRFYRLTTP